MRLKTFISTYLLFICILFANVTIVSVYMTNSQINMLKEHSSSQFQTISSSLARDISVLWGRNVEPDTNFYDAVDTLVRGYARYYARHNIHITITNLQLSEQESEIREPEMSMVNIEQYRFINIAGPLPSPFGHFVLEYRLDITKSIADMQNIQHILLLVAVAFSIVAAFVLHFILSSIFKPLAVVANASKKIAGGEFGERINIKGENELAKVAIDFNKMAQTIETQMAYLEEEVINKQQFVDNFAHEIRTPLTSIYGYAQYMQKARLTDEEIIESAEYIMNEAGHMSNIANSLLELATLRNYTPARNAIDVSKLFTDVAQALENPLRKNGAKLTYSDANVIVFGQEDLIRSLLLNLCTNAIKACTYGKGKISLNATEHEDCVIISVTDNGCGIPEDSLPQICEPFYRVDKARSREHGGVGLGLTLCRQIMEAHDAEMTMQSTVGVGTIIKIKFTTP